jgi:2-methylaconitate cis-trans-isomerase PrpF
VAGFVRAGDLGLKGPESPIDIEGNKTLMNTLEEVRISIAQMANSGEKSKIQLPMVAIVQEPVAWRNFVSGAKIEAEEATLLLKIYTPGMMHKAYAGAGCIVTGVAARIKGTIVNDIIGGKQNEKDEIIIGHFSGLLPVEIKGQETENGFKIEKAIMYRTARRIMEGHFYV